MQYDGTEKVAKILFPDGKDRDVNLKFLQAVVEYLDRNKLGLVLPLQDENLSCGEGSSSSVQSSIKVVDFKDSLAAKEDTCDTSIIANQFSAGEEFAVEEVISVSDIVHAETPRGDKGRYACANGNEEASNISHAADEDEASSYIYDDAQEEENDDDYRDDSAASGPAELSEMMGVDEATGDGVEWIQHDDDDGDGDGAGDDSNAIINQMEEEEEEEDVAAFEHGNETLEHNGADASRDNITSLSSSFSSAAPRPIKEVETLLHNLTSMLAISVKKHSLSAAQSLLKVLQKSSAKYRAQGRLAIVKSGPLRTLCRWLQKPFDRSSEQKVVLKVLAMATATAESATFEFSELLPDGALLDDLLRLLCEPKINDESRLQVLCVLSHLVQFGGLGAQQLLGKNLEFLDALLPLKNTRRNRHCLESSLFLIINLRLDLDDDPTVVAKYFKSFVERLIPEAAFVLKHPLWHSNFTTDKVAAGILKEACTLLQAFTDDSCQHHNGRHHRVAMIQAHDIVPMLLDIDQQIAEKFQRRRSSGSALTLEIAVLETAALRLLLGLTSGSDATSASVIHSGGSDLLAMFSARLCDGRSDIRSCICNMIWNITGGTAAQCNFVAQAAQVVSSLRDLLEEDPRADDENHCDAWSFAAKALFNILIKGDASDCFQMCKSKNGRLIRTICQRVLACPERDPELIPLAVLALKSSLQRLNGDPKKKLALWKIWHNEDALALLTRLSTHPSADISSVALKTVSNLPLYYEE